MDEYLKQAIELARAQASVRVMSEEDIAKFVATLAAKLRGLTDSDTVVSETTASALSAEEVKRSIKEKSVTCLECGKSFKILSKRHLSLHGLTSEEYRNKYGIKKGTALVCKALVRERRKKMETMQLWEKRRKMKGMHK
ncbi:MAG: MucR family transcriptional regulator [Desulfovibrionaceae bacterium]|nr:MucR family transcriptional regulator [Desulfovibrionaceae bacterium]